MITLAVSTRDPTRSVKSVKSKGTVIHFRVTLLIFQLNSQSNTPLPAPVLTWAEEHYGFEVGILIAIRLQLGHAVAELL